MGCAENRSRDLLLKVETTNCDREIIILSNPGMKEYLVSNMGHSKHTTFKEADFEVRLLGIL